MGGLGFHSIDVPIALPYRPSLSLMSRKEAASEQHAGSRAVVNTLNGVRDALTRCAFGVEALKLVDADGCEVIANMIQLDLERRYPRRGHEKSVTGRSRAMRHAENVLKFMRAHNIDLRNALNGCLTFQTWKPLKDATADQKLLILGKCAAAKAESIRRKSFDYPAARSNSLELQILKEFTMSLISQIDN